MPVASRPSLPEVLADRARSFGDGVALRYMEGDHRKETTYRELWSEIEQFARGLAAAGVVPGDRVFLLADNSPRWLVADLGIQRAGAVPVPRAADSTEDEIAWILLHSEAKAVVVDRPRLLSRLPPGPIPLRVLLYGEVPGAALSWSELLSRGETERELPGPTTLCSVIYTSGTTGHPRGVMLTHENVLHQIRVLPPLLGVGPGDVFLSILPSWHVFERTVEYVVLASGATLSYSSLRTLKHDLQSERPTFLAAVPRLWESFRDRVALEIAAKGPVGRFFGRFLLARALGLGRSRARARGELFETPPRGRVISALFALVKTPLGLIGRATLGAALRRSLGGRLRAGVSGGGFLAPGVDLFFASLGVRILVGFGLTETAPVLTLRRPERNVLGTIGPPVPETEVRVTDPAGDPVPEGVVGEIQARGPQVMTGYDRDEIATRAVLAPGGWFRTGDLGHLTGDGDLVFVGRLKETIVLSGGENVEPGPIEARILESPFVVQAMVVGQDRKLLGALLVPDPERARPECEARRISLTDLLRGEVERLVNRRNGFKSRELVSRIAVVEDGFRVEDGTLTRTMKLKRNVIADRYAPLIEGLYGGNSTPPAIRGDGRG